MEKYNAQKDVREKYRCMDLQQPEKPLVPGETIIFLRIREVYDAIPAELNEKRNLFITVFE